MDGLILREQIALVIDDPARLAQQPCNLAIAVAAVSLGKLDNIGRQALP
jgi:hypothetical protein